MRQLSAKSVGAAFLFVIFLMALPIVAESWFSDSEQLGWRIKAIRLKMLGAVPDESWLRIILRLRPPALRGVSGGPRGLEGLRVVSVLESDRDLQAGEQIFQSRCEQCHTEGGGHMGPDLTNPSSRTRLDDSDIYWAISEGIEGTSMPPSQRSETEILQLTAFVDSLVEEDAETEGRTESTRSSCPACEAIDVSFEQLREASRSSDQWLTYSGSYNGQRFSHLQQINRENVSLLRPRWVHQLKSLEAVKTHPLVAGGVMFLTGPRNEVMALDAGTGEVLWTFARPIPSNLPFCCINRGVAILGKRVYHATIDGRLIALDITSGRPVWEVEVSDSKTGYFSMTGAPLAVKDKIIVGISGGDFGGRGFLDAYDAETGERVWRFYTVPGPGEAGHETWENEAWETGGGATWITGSYDPDLNLLYWGVGNPAPTFDGDYRPGDNLYTCSVLALDPDTGELKWHYQFIPHDTNDWDAALVPVLADLEYGGAVRQLMLWANRNCFYYVLDRKTGEFLQAKQYCEQNWNDGFTSEGRPLRRPDTHPTDEGVMIQPGPYGGSNWWSPAFSPHTGLYYIMYLGMNQFIRRSTDEFTPGDMFNRGWSYPASKDIRVSGVRAIHGATGEVAWDKVFEGQGEANSEAGILVTASDLVFTGNSFGQLLALDARTGEELWTMGLGGRIAMGPVTYLHEGRQNVAVIAAGALFVLDLAQPVDPPKFVSQGPATTNRSTID